MTTNTGCVKYINETDQCGATDTEACSYCGLPVCATHARRFTGWQGEAMVACPRNHN